jgi:fumarylacetoacetase
VAGYLREDERYTFDVELCVEWNGVEVSRPPFRTQYWTPAQQLAHLTVNGASLRTGDLYASGTISGPERGQVGSFLELSRGGAEPVALGDGGTRTFLVDGDTVTIRGQARGLTGGVVDLGAVTGTVVPAGG